MNIKIISVGNLKEKYWKDATAEYLKRLKSYCSVDVIEIKESSLSEEGEKILSRVNDSDYLIALDIRGEKLSSEALSKKIFDLGLNGVSNIAFVIGGSIGLSEEVLKRAKYRLSFSDMTFPHQMMRVILLEQIYRSFKIQRNEPYHK